MRLDSVQMVMGLIPHRDLELLFFPGSSQKITAFLLIVCVGPENLHTLQLPLQKELSGRVLNWNLQICVGV